MSDSGRRVLLIEDTAVLRRLIEVAVAKMGVELICRADGRSGLDAVFEDEPDLILLDIGVPELDGWQVIEAVRGVGPEPPILVVTAHGSSADERRAISLGADGFLAKPFRPSDLLDQIERFLPQTSTP